MQVFKIQGTTVGADRHTGLYKMLKIKKKYSLYIGGLTTIADPLIMGMK